MRSRKPISAWRRAFRPPRAAAASSGKLIWMSAAVKSCPANQGRSASSASIQSRWRVICGSMKPAFTLRAMARATGLTKNGIGPRSSRSKTSFIRSGGIAEPSA